MTECLTPLVPVRGDPNKALVRTYQRWLVSKGATIKVDGDYGPATARAAAQYGEPAPRCVPPLSAWVDRAWATDTADTLKIVKTQFRANRVGLMLNSVGDGPVFKPFGDRDEVRRFVDGLAKIGVGFDLTIWIWPSMSYLNAALDFVGPLLAEYPQARLDLDTESAWASKRYTDADRRKVAAELYKHVPPGRVSVNDYVTLQKVTRILLVPGVRRRPQAYSVGHTTFSGSRHETVPGSIFYPGETQARGLEIWGDACAGPFDMGIALYKPVAGLTVAEQVDRQIAGALWADPSELWSWQLRTTRDYYLAIQKYT